MKMITLNHYIAKWMWIRYKKKGRGLVLNTKDLHPEYSFLLRRIGGVTVLHKGERIAASYDQYRDILIEGAALRDPVLGMKVAAALSEL